jgi:NAD(P)H-nitrite reductase large subunit
MGSFKVYKHVIIGNSAAAVSGIKAIRKNDSRSCITLISAENYCAYPPVLLTYYISQKVTRKNLFLVGHNFYKDYQVNPIFGIKATKVDAANQLVLLADGREVEYDNLLIATGSQPRPLGIEGENLQGIFTLKGLEDADEIIESSGHMKEIVFVGGGLISLQTADALFRKDKKITLVVGSKQLLSQNLDADYAKIVTGGIEKFGLTILFETNVINVVYVKNKLKLELSSGKSIDADTIIVGKGVTPNIQLVKKSGIAINKGIIVDENMRTNVPNVFAAGDVAEGPNVVSGEKEVIATWRNACLQGRTAGINMAGGSSKFLGLNGNISSFFGRMVAWVGITKPENKNFEDISHTDQAKGLYRKIIFNERDEIVGAILLGRVDDIGVFSNLIRNRVKIPREIRTGMVRSTMNMASIFSKKTFPRV